MSAPPTTSSEKKPRHATGQEIASFLKDIIAQQTPIKPEIDAILAIDDFNDDMVVARLQFATLTHFRVIQKVVSWCALHMPIEYQSIVEHGEKMRLAQGTLCERSARILNVQMPDEASTIATEETWPFNAFPGYEPEYPRLRENMKLISETCDSMREEFERIEQEYKRVKGAFEEIKEELKDIMSIMSQAIE